MAEFTNYQPGTFCWVDLATTDAAGAKEFYGQFFGWELTDMPAGPDSVYTMAQLQGKTVAGLYTLNEQQQEQGLPPHWMSYISVSNAEEVAARAKSLGGQVLDEPFDVMEAGRMGVIQDPTGAVVALWQPGQHIGSQVANLPGSFTWNELATTDTEAAGKFYTRLFGWSTQVQEMPQTTYTSFLNGERMNAGMLQMTEEWGDIPPHWMVYFAVEDCDASAEKATSLGAKVHVPPTDIPPVGRFAVIEDPQGAVFTIIKLNNPE
jgi:predicted enzyme related to lactoylglutathione lyase